MRTALLVLIAFSAFAADPKPATPGNDAAVESAIRAKFAKSKISTNNFKVTVKSGVALLEGKTDVPQHKGVATRLAKSGGARQVVNKIQIGEAAKQKLSDRLRKARESKSKPRSASPPKAASVAPAPQTKPQALSQVAPQTKPQSTAKADEPAPIRRAQIKR